MGLTFKIEIGEFQKKLRDRMDTVERRTEMVADLIAQEIVNHARSKSNETQPPAKPGEGRRQAHPGGWADITSNLANSIKGRVERDGLKVTAVVEATMEYAAALDAKEGYEVLGGADELARQALKKHGHKIFKGL